MPNNQVIVDIAHKDLKVLVNNAGQYASDRCCVLFLQEKNAAMTGFSS